MINSLSNTFKALLDQWPEVFEDIEINVIPIVYLDKVTVKFTSGMKWEVNVKDYLEEYNPEKIESMLWELYEEYKDDIAGFEYYFDVEKLKKDLSKLSNKLL